MSKPQICGHWHLSSSCPASIILSFSQVFGRYSILHSLSFKVMVPTVSKVGPLTVAPVMLSVITALLAGPMMVSPLTLFVVMGFLAGPMMVSHVMSPAVTGFLARPMMVPSVTSHAVTGFLFLRCVIKVSVTSCSWSSFIRSVVESPTMSIFLSFVMGCLLVISVDPSCRS